MKEIKEVLKPLSKNLQTPVGQKGSTSKSNAEPKATNKHIAAINALFAELEAAYPSQFRTAFHTEDLKNQAKKVWLHHLKQFTPNRILASGQKAINRIIHGDISAKYLPNLATIKELCIPTYEEFGFKQPRAAYIEACLSRGNREKFSWSHRVICIAGEQTGWHFLDAERESLVFPIFEKNYNYLCDQLFNGQDLADLTQGIEDQNHNNDLRTAHKVQEQQLKDQMADLGIDPNGGRAVFEKLLGNSAANEKLS